MKTWTDINADLKYMKQYIANLSQEIEQVGSRETDNRMLMYEQIDRMAQQYPIKNIRVRAASEVTKKSYLILLAALVHLDQNLIEPKLLFLQRIAYGIDYDINSEELLKNGIVHKNTAIDRVLEHAGDHTLSLLLDSLLIVNLTGRSSETELSFIAELAALLKVKSAEMAVIAQLTGSLIEHDKKSFIAVKVPEGNNWFGLFTHHVPEEWLAALRNKGGSFSNGRKFIANETAYFRRRGVKPYASLIDGLHKQLEVRAASEGYHLMYINWREQFITFLVNGFDDQDRVQQWAIAEGHLT